MKPGFDVNVWIVICILIKNVSFSGVYHHVLIARYPEECEGYVEANNSLTILARSKHGSQDTPDADDHDTICHCSILTILCYPNLLATLQVSPRSVHHLVPGHTCPDSHLFQEMAHVFPTSGVVAAGKRKTLGSHKTNLPTIPSREGSSDKV